MKIFSKIPTRINYLSLMILSVLLFSISFTSIGEEPNLPNEPIGFSGDFTNDEVVSIESSMGAPHYNVYISDYIVKKYAGRPLASLMISFVNDEKRQENQRLAAMSVLSLTHDERGIQIMKSFIEKNFDTKISRKDYVFLNAAIRCLGPLAKDDKTLDYLLNLSTEDYWEEHNPNLHRSNSTPSKFHNSMRRAAISSIATSGTDRAIEILETGNGLPTFVNKNEQNNLLRLAKMRKQGVYRVSEYKP